VERRIRIMEISFENLKKIDTILEALNLLNSKILNLENRLVPKLDLTKRDGVKKFLDISDSTLYKMINDGRLKQGVHYKKTLKGKRVNIIFVESAIVNFKENPK
jgi:predicted DNA-binding transcriptional regulator AlpA